MSEEMDRELVERVARAIAMVRGDNPDHVPRNKSDWLAKRGDFGGRFRDVNEPFWGDYQDMAEAAIAAMRPEPVPVIRFRE
jgi:hypothetical protein